MQEIAGIPKIANRNSDFLALQKLEFQRKIPTGIFGIVNGIGIPPLMGVPEIGTKNWNSQPSCLVMLLLGFLEHLLGLLDLQLAGPHIITGRDGFLGPSSLQVILESPGQLHNSLSKLPTLYVEPLLLDDA